MSAVTTTIGKAICDNRLRFEKINSRGQVSESVVTIVCFSRKYPHDNVPCGYINQKTRVLSDLLVTTTHIRRRVVGTLQTRGC